MVLTKEVKCKKAHSIKNNLEKLTVDRVVIGVKSTNSNFKNSVNKEYRVGEDIILQNGIQKNAAELRPQKQPHLARLR
jgi:hypothetical protein